MSNLEVPNEALKNFQESIKDKIKKDIADSLPDDALKAMFDKCVEEEFFKDREIKGDFGRVTYQKSWFVESVVTEAKPILESEVNNWLEENKDVIKKALEDYLKPEILIPLVCQRMIRGYVDYELSNALNNIESRLSGLNI